MRPGVTTATDPLDGLPRSRVALAVLTTLHRAGTRVAVLCFTHGEASTLGSDVSPDQLHTVRAAEMAAASQVMGLHHVDLCDYPDGHLSAVPLDGLSGLAAVRATDHTADLLVFDAGGVTGHPTTSAPPKRPSRPQKVPTYPS
jgi:LmbE family N-acetylglucosaminyl deacetylase